MSDKSTIEQLRRNIDECDTQLVELLKKRQTCVDQLVDLKHSSGDPLFVPEREESIFAKVRVLANTHGVCPDLIQDVLQRVMRDSYQRQAQMQYPCASEQAKSICIVGGAGQLGRFFATHFKRSGHQVSIIETEDWPMADKVFATADLALVAVPIKATDEVIQRLGNLPAHCILADITSIKHQPLQRMLQIHSGPVVGLHPMFGPGLSHLARQLMLYCDGRDAESYQWLLKQFELWGCYVRVVNAKEHDEVMSIVQALRHFNTFIAGWQLKASNTDLNQLTAMSSPIYRMELALIGRLFAQEPELYVDILLKASHGLDILKQYQELYHQACKWLENKDREQLIEQFKEIAEYFGSWKEDFFNQSDTLLEAFRERL